MAYKNPEKRREHAKRYYLNNADRINTRNKQYYRDNYVKIRAKIKAYAKSDRVQQRKMFRQSMLAGAAYEQLKLTTQKVLLPTTLPALPRLNQKEHAVEIAYRIFSSSQQNGLPIRGSMEYTWIVNKRVAKKVAKAAAKIGYKEGVSKWYPVLDDIAAQFGFDGIFDRADLLKIKASGVFGRAKIRGSLPNGGSRNLQEKKDANWLRSVKQTNFRRVRSGRKVIYPFLFTIAKQHGFPCAFEKVGKHDKKAHLWRKPHFKKKASKCL